MGIVFSPKQLQIIRAPYDHTLEVNEGTPRSSKTTAGVFRYADYLATTPDQNHLVAAYNQEQAFRLFMECDGFGLIHIFGDLAKIKHDENGDHLEVHTPSGVKKVYYKGGGKVDSKKAITGMSLGSVAFCEIDLLHMDFIQECFRRTFAAKMRYHLADLNPPAPNHPVISKVFDVQKTRWVHWTIDDNPIITEERKQEIYETLIKNPYLLQRDWFGKRVIPAGVIYSMFDVKENVAQKMEGQTVEMFFAGDGGQSDATSVSCNVVTKLDGQREFRLYRVAHYYHSGAETGDVKAMSVYAKEIKEFILWCQEKTGMSRSDVYIDPACKSLREELHLLGIQTEKADNNNKDIKGSSKGLEVGIERLQNAMTSKRLVLLEQTDSEYDHYNFIKEIGIYARDKNGTPVDDNNHAMDEARYANNYFYKRYVL
ncbi:PBSX family phage terminase large subunit [Shouchella hunanensis]|uniref:PBSX family phage terminase large subunit n=1 Tax=Shouchella hunanensis TaxID=766894 RepID=A0ABY7W308_9BACI|nr:PBSX family phage terminase large subunit [Shouchella hunanensis]WDF02946.1 PBSX family phage terminase large subunit [Shouchella hunanensis]